MNKKSYLYWPIKLGWKSRGLYNRQLISWFSWHGWQVGWMETGYGIFGWTFHLGRLLIKFGKDQNCQQASNFNAGGRG